MSRTSAHKRRHRTAKAQDHRSRNRTYYALARSRWSLIWERLTLAFGRFRLLWGKPQPALVPRGFVEEDGASIHFELDIDERELRGRDQ